MVLEGATPRQVDGALEAWGMAMGILAVFDMAGIDVGVNVHKAQRRHVPAGPDLLPGGFRAARGGPPRPEDRQGLLQLPRRAIARATTIRRRSRFCAAPPRDCGVPQRTHSDAGNRRTLPAIR